MKMYSERYPELYTLLCGYFNQDWMDEYDTPEAVISGFARDGDKKGIEDVILELKRLLQEKHTIMEWYQLISDEFSCEYSLRLRNIDPVEWLKKVQQQLEDELKLAKQQEEGQKPQI